MQRIDRYFDELIEPRYGVFVDYPLRELLFSIFICLLCGAHDYEDIHDYSVEYLPWYRKFLPFEHGIPCVVTYQRVMRMLSPESLAQCFGSLMKDLLQEGVLERHGTEPPMRAAIVRQLHRMTLTP